MKENYKVEGNMIITTIGDEIGTTLEDQIEALKEVNMKYIEIRKINDIYIWKYSEEQLSLIHISEPTRQEAISYAVFCLKKKKK